MPHHAGGYAAAGSTRQEGCPSAPAEQKAAWWVSIHQLAALHKLDSAVSQATMQGACGKVRTCVAAVDMPLCCTRT